MEAERSESWRVLEFYSGIGGMRYSLMKAGILATVVEAFEINDSANDVYEHNFDHRPYQGNIGSVTVADLDKYGAHAWLLSPPCQPYTRQGLQRDADDARALSFLRILDLLPQMKETPLMIFVENVVGFEKSETQKRLISCLENAGFVTQEYILSPLQFGVPYSRPRYFCLAKRYPLSFANSDLNSQLLETHHHFQTCENDAWVERLEVLSCKPLSEFLETVEIVTTSTSLGCKSTSASALPLNRTNGSDDVFEGGLNDIKLFQHSDKVSCKSKNHKDSISVENKIDQFAVPSSLIERFGSSMDIIFPESRRCCCFTKSYYRYVKGTGSLLATIQEHQLEGKPAASLLYQLGLRYFTPREVANLHSFPQEFKFPEHISLRQRTVKCKETPVDLDVDNEGGSPSNITEVVISALNDLRGESCPMKNLHLRKCGGFASKIVGHGDDFGTVSFTAKVRAEYGF